MPKNKTTHNQIHNAYRLALALPTLLWMALIFYLSAQPATQSGKLSTGITRDILKAGEKMGLIKSGTSSNDVLILSLDDLLRSGGHFIAFLILSVLVFALFKTLFKTNLKQYVYSFIFCAIYAASDEVHQYFVPGRAFQLSDFVVDCFGIISGIVLTSILINLIKKDSKFIKKIYQKE